jgi:serine/threonine protein kinase
MGISWQVDKERLALPDREVFASMEGLLQSPMEAVTRDRFSAVSRLDLQHRYYVKVFSGRHNRWQHLLGRSRYQREIRNLAYFARLGLATPELVAHGRRLRRGLLDSAALVTEEVTGAVDLYQLVCSGAFYSRGTATARRILDQLARATRLMHDDGFYHQDLKPRNVLVRFERGEPELLFFDCPRGHHPSPLRFRRCVVLELAHIERDLRGRVRRSDLMYLYKQYRGCQRLSEDDKDLARQALTYYSERRMTARRRKRQARRDARQRRAE